MWLSFKKKERESWTGLVQGLAAYYQSPGRLAGLRRQFESAFRQPGLDPATFATDLGMLAIQGFGDMREQARDTMIRDKFIAGQEQCALRRQLDGFAQDTPIGEIVDSCRVWESHSDSNRIAKKNVDSKAETQSGDSRTWERNKVTVVVDRREPEMEVRKEDRKPKWIERLGVLWQECLTENDRKQSRSPGNERGFVRVGQPLGPRRIKAPLTLEGVPTRLKKGCLLGRCRELMEGVANGEWMVRNSQHWGRRRRPERSSDQPIPMIPGGAGNRVDTRFRSPGWWTGGCGRRRTFGQFGKGTAMFGHGVSEVP